MPTNKTSSTKIKTYIIPEPQHEYAIHMIRYLKQQHQLEPIFIYDNSHMELFKREYYPELKQLHPHAVFFRDLQSLQTISEKIKEHYEVLGIIPYYEQSIEPMAELSELLGIHWNPRKLMDLFRNKGHLKAYILSRDPSISLGVFHTVKNFQELKSLQLPKRYVVKPSDGAANSNIGFFNESTTEDPLKNYFTQGKAKYYTVEELFIGEEYAINGFMDEKGKGHITNIIHYQRVPGNGKPNLYHFTHHVHRHNPAFEPLASYAKQIMEATGLLRCPFHMEAMLTEQGPRLIEVGARFAGIRLSEMVNEVHQNHFNYFAVAAHFYLYPEAINHIGFNWDYYDKVNYLHVDGISYKRQRIYHLRGIKEIEAMPEFTTWVIKPFVGMITKKTIDLYSVPYSFCLISERRSQEELMALAEEAKMLLKINEPKSYIRSLTIEAQFTLKRFQQKLLWQWEHQLISNFSSLRQSHPLK